ncbi:MAG: hypothetical protein JWR81_6901, partial [Pseudonocardia sp.]|nr:hypothetical protein [Pseudonocardia sp.]
DDPRVRGDDERWRMVHTPVTG